MYRRRRSGVKRSRTPEDAGVAAVASAMKRRVYNAKKGAAMVQAMAAAGAIQGADKLVESAVARSQSMRGYGDYFGKTAGSYLGGLTGIPGAGAIGGFLGDKAGDFLKKKLFGHGMYTGHGDYTSTNSLISAGGDAHNTPLFGTMRDVSFSHREYITDIFGPPGGASFNVQSYSINPALNQSFPFLSQIAANFEEYEFAQLIYTYKSTTTDIGNSTTGQCGTVVMCANYNAAAAPFTDKGSMMEYFGSVSCKVTERSQCGIECDPTKNAGPPILYTRSNPTIVSQDLKTYDLGTFQLAVANSPAAYANLPIGELWVDYTIILRKPKLFSARGLDVDKDAFLSGPGATLSTSAWFGLGTGYTLYSQQNNIGCVIQPATLWSYSGTTTPVQTSTGPAGCSIIVPAGYNGNLRITARIYSTAASLGGYPSLTLLGNITAISDIYASSGTQPTSSYIVPSTTYTIVVYDVFVKQATAISYNAGVYSGGNNIIVLGTLSAGTPSSASIEVEQYQPLGGLKGLTATTDRVVWVNQGGIVVVPV